MIAQKVAKPELVNSVVDVLIWTGCLGVRSQGTVFYISDCGFKRPYFRGLIADPDENCLLFRPTLASIFGAPSSGPTNSTAPRLQRGTDKRQAALPGFTSD